MPTEVSEAIANEAGVEVRPLRTLETISQEESAEGLDYFDLMNENLASLTK